MADPIVVELREFARIAEHLTVERNRLREQLWRLFPLGRDRQELCPAQLSSDGC
jgi:hypothetical protein